MPDPQNLQIKASHKRIADVFSSGYAFSIPAYQRPYAWEKTQVKELLTDLTDAINPQSNPGQFYFLGSIVLVKGETYNPECQVLDGQQRLTTLTILFSVIRDLTEDAALRAEREALVRQDAINDQGIPETLRLQLRHNDQDFFRKHIQKSGSTGNLPAKERRSRAQVLLIQNATTIRKYLKRMEEAQRSELLRFLLQNCYLVVVEVPTQTTARRIFTVLNARGMDLTATDILKADLLERAGEAVEGDFSRRWEDSEEDIGREDFNDLFTHIRMIFERKKPRSALEKGFPKHVIKFRKDPHSFMDDVFEPFADSLLLSRDDKMLRSRFGSRTADLVRSLSRLDNNDWLPPLLLCLRQCNDGQRNRDYVKKFVFRLERLAYFLFVVRAHVNARIERYARVLNYLEPPNKDKARAGTKKRSASLLLSQRDCNGLFSALDGDVYLQARVVKPLLLRLELASTDGSASYDYPVISVEHVCPQKVEEGSQWAKWYSEKDHKTWVHKIGNLTLLSSRKNARASNLDFQRKKDKYFFRGDSTPFTLTSELRKTDSWKPDDISRRHCDLLERLAKDWGISDEYEEWRNSND